MAMQATAEAADATTGETADRVEATTGKIVDRAGAMTGKTVDRAGATTGRTVDRAEATTGKTVDGAEATTGKTVDGAEAMTGKTVDRAGATTGRTADRAEVAKFDALAAAWWEPRGPMAMLHAMNDARIGWVRERATLNGARVLDVGCGAGLASEALARAGAAVTGVDAAAEVIAAARAHAAAGGLAIDYLVGGPEDIGGEYDVVVAFEVIEHVDDHAAFLGALAARLKPGGRLFLSTLNRNPVSWLVAKFGAEYVARLLPVGTHDWKKFVKPAELNQALRGAGLRMVDISGMAPDVVRGGWRTGMGVGVNYLVEAVRG